MVSIKWLKLLYFGLFLIVLSAGLEFQPSGEFSRHTLIRPKIYHGREKREISTSKEVGPKHVDYLTLIIPLGSENVTLDLQLNRDLIPKNYFEKHQTEAGAYVVNYPKSHEIELCHYNGNIRGIRHSWVAVSTCDGIRGVIYDGREMHYIERIPVTNETKLTDTHVIYSHNDLISNFNCGFNSTPHFVHRNDVSENHRIKRDTSKVHGPYNANRLSRYIELVLVIDNKEFKAFNEDTSRVYQHCKDIANIVNSLYVPLNIFVALVGVVIWTRDDEIVLETNGDKTLTNFLLYRKDRLLKDHPNDNAQLLTRLQFSDGVVGKALKGPICTFEFSGGVNVDHSNTVGLVASTVAHEMGHNLGMEHDTTECTCPSERCIMSPSSSSTSPTEWSSCSIEYLTVAFEHGMDYCLRNKPESLFDSPVCGNGFVEPGEQCDCGLKDKCNNPCCNTTTCMLYANASCATGECCDLKTCKPHTAGTVCRSAEHECDLPEYCTGQSEYCPEDVFKVDGEICNKGTAFCYQGNCRSHSDQCRILWGPSGQSSDMQCYKQNMKGNRSGNCGYNRLNQSYIKCKEENVYCGMLQCKHFNERLEFGMESVAILSHSFISIDNSVIPCRTAIVDLGLNEVDPGLAPDGAKCGENKMCLNQKCMEIDSLRAISTPGACPHNCNGNGVCNSKGHCHCRDGFAPPFCEYPGVGGSEDSGPAANPYSYNGLSTAISFMAMVVLVLVMALAAYSYYVRKSPTYFWKRNQRRTVYVSSFTHTDCTFDGCFSWCNITWLRNTSKRGVKHERVHEKKHAGVPKTPDIVHPHLNHQNSVKEAVQSSGMSRAIERKNEPEKSSKCETDTIYAVPEMNECDRTNPIVTSANLQSLLDEKSKQIPNLPFQPKPKPVIKSQNVSNSVPFQPKLAVKPMIKSQNAPLHESKLPLVQNLKDDLIQRRQLLIKNTARQAPVSVIKAQPRVSNQALGLKEERSGSAQNEGSGEDQSAKCVNELKKMFEKK